MKNLKIVAVDPSLTSTGLVIFKEGELTGKQIIKTTPETKERLTVIADTFQRVLLAEEPDIMIIETQYAMPIRSNSFLKVTEVKGLFVGVFIATQFMLGKTPKIINITPMEAKKAVGVTGRHKRAESKKLVKKRVAELFPKVTVKSQDIADAIAIGVAGIEKLAKVEKVC